MRLIHLFIGLLSLIVLSGLQADLSSGDANSVDAIVSPTSEQHRLEGKWEGVMIRHEQDGKITLTITGNALKFYRDPAFWFETSFTVITDTEPKRIRATIQKGASGQDYTHGEVVVAMYKIEGDKLTLAPIDPEADAPKTFEQVQEMQTSRYELKRAPTLQEPSPTE